MIRMIVACTHLSILIDLQAANHRTGIKRRHLRYVVIFTLTLLFLELEGDTPDGTLLDTFHQVGCEAGDFVAETFGWDYGLFGKSSNNGNEHHKLGLIGQLIGVRTTSSMIRLFVWKSRVRRG